MSIEQVLNLCANDVGYLEGKNNNTKFGKWYGLNYNPWCAMAASKMFYDAGIIKSVAARNKPKGYASCDEWLKYLARNGQLVPVGQARAGDIVFYQFDDDAAPDHVGIVKSNSPRLRQLKAYEGNTSSGKKGSQANGVGFYLRRRGYGTIMAVARPKGIK